MGLLRLVKHAIARSHFRRSLQRLDLERYRVRVAHTVDEYEDAFRLLRIAYVFQGLQSVRGADMRMTEQHVLPESTVFVAYEDERIVGTMTVTLDSPAGLPLDKDYPRALGLLRERQARVAEYGSLAVVRSCWHTGVTTLLNMAANWFALNVLHATHVVVGLHPRVADYYSAVYNFSPLGPPRHHAQLCAAVAGLCHELQAARNHFAKRYRQLMSTGLYPYEHFCEFLPACIEIPQGENVEDLMRWKLPRPVFQELFIHRSDRLRTLDEQTRTRLDEWRSENTLIGAEPMARTA